MKRVCMYCYRPAIKGLSRCSKHRRGKPSSGPSEYDSIHQGYRKQVLKGNPICHICGEGAEAIPIKGPFQADHVIPVSLGGRSELSNYAPAHRRCNISKGGANRRRTGG